mgnify:FL=1
MRYNQLMGEIVDPFLGDVISEIHATTDGIVFFAHKDPLVNEGDIVFRLIHRLHA